MLDIIKGTRGVDHVGIGVRDLVIAKSFYTNILGFKHIFGELPEKDHKPINSLLRTSPTIHSAILFKQEISNISLSLFHMVIPVPRPIRVDFRYGDIGVAKMSIAIPDIEKFYLENRDKINFCSKLKIAVIPGWGDYNFVYGKDPEGNLLEFVSSQNIKVTSPYGCVYWIGVSVTDLERSISFYQKNLGFDKVYINTHNSFSGLVDEISGGKQTEVRSCVLANSNGGGMVELFEVMKPRGRSIPFGTIWGDFGYLQLCLYCESTNDVIEYYKKENLEFITRPQQIDDLNINGSFWYIQDPDGILIEFMNLL